MKKTILISIILFFTVNIYSQKAEIIKEKHYFEQVFSAGFITSSIANVVTYKITKNKYISLAASVIAGIGGGFIVNEYNYYNNKETSSRDVINSGYGIIASNICFNIVLNKNKKKKELIEF